MGIKESPQFCVFPISRETFFFGDSFPRDSFWQGGQIGYEARVLGMRGAHINNAFASRARDVLRVLLRGFYGGLWCFMGV